MPADIAALLTPGRVLTAEDVAQLSAALEPAWKARQRRLDARDNALRQALATLAHLGPTSAARAVERAWNSHRRGAPCFSAIAEPIAAAALHHGDKSPLTAAQIARVGRGERTAEIGA